MTNALKKILSRHLDSEEKTYVNLYSFDDKKKAKKTYNYFYELNKGSIDKIVEEIYFYNVGTNAVFYNLNPLKTKKRTAENVSRIKYIFIDIDNAATQEDYDSVKQFLDLKGFHIFYSCISGSGYHILLDVDLDISEQPNVKKFVQYLNANINSKIDLKTADLPRICRAPESEHNKKEPFKLKTLILNDEDCKNNNELYKEFLIEEKKEEISIEYQESLDREDYFFSTLLNNNFSWHEHIEELNKHDKEGDGEGSNKIFNKNLAIFVSKNPDYLSKAEMFMNTWNNQYVTLKRFHFFLDKVKKGNLENNKGNLKVSYFELSKWANTYKLEKLKKLLDIQIATTFLDDFEVYYLEEEKKEQSYLLYFPVQNYYVQKTLQELLIIIYFKSVESGVDIENELGLLNIDKWDDKSQLEKQRATLSAINSKLIKENRIKLIYNINYEPSNEKFIYRDNKKYFNIYKKTKLMDQNISNVTDYDFRHIKELVMNLCENKEEYYNWFINWIAYQIQNPTSKLPSAVIFQGEQGTGKGVLKNLILDPIFGQNCQEINQTHLESQFNEYLLGKQIIIANEVMHNENRQTLPNVLKNLVTDETITIQRKFRSDLVINNYTHWIFCTNSDNPIKIEEGDRRYSVFKSKKLKGGGKAAMEFVKSLIDNKEHELPHFLQYLKELEIDYYYVAQPILTEAKEDIIELNKNSIERFLDYLKTFPTLEKAALSVQNNKFSFVTDKNSTNDEVIISELFYLMYESYCDKYKERGMFNKISFGRKLNSFGIENTNGYLSNRKKSARYFLLETIENYMEGEK